MIKYILSVIIVLASLSSAQTKYFIYLKDKGVEEKVNLEKNSPAYLSALSLLSEKSI